MDGREREQVLRGMFSLIAAASLLYMSSEYVEAALKTRKLEVALLSMVCASLAILEAGKVGRRVERFLGLRVGA